MVCWTRSTQPLVGGRPARMTLCRVPREQWWPGSWQSGPPGGQGAGPLRRGLRRVTWRVAQVEALATSMAVDCPTVPLVPDRRPIQKTVQLDQLAGMVDLEGRLGWRRGPLRVGGAA